MKVIFTSIVKNESSIIGRCLDAVKHLADAYCISDTGSTDNTVEVINTFLENRTGTVVHQEWKNFGHNRTLNFRTTREYVQNTLKWDLKDTYALTLDADMIVKATNLNKSELVDEGYYIYQLTGGVEYPNIRMMRLDIDWVSHGVTHEVWMGGKAGMLPKNTCYINDVNDGGSKSDKYTRDAALLKQAVIDEPDNARYVFYLAQTYRDLGEYDNAIEWYKKRATMTGWYEEVWYSMFMIGRIYLLNKNEESEGEEWLLKAHSLNPKRAEPTYYLTKYFREKNKHQKAIIYCNLGCNLGIPDLMLFIEKPVYDFLFHLELTILMFYTHTDLRAGLVESMKYLLKHTEHSKLVNNNLIHYIDNIQNTINPFPTIHDVLGFDFHPSSVSVCNGIYNIRYVNYDINHKNGSYMMKDGDYSTQYPVRTKNVALYKGTLIHMQEDNPPRDSFIKGLEDVRLYVNKNNVLSFVASSAEYADGIQIVNGTYNLNSNKLENCKVVESPTSALVEKNWLPISGTDDIIYKWGPLEIGSIVNDKLKIHTQYETPPFFQQLRGSAVPIKVGNELWALTHFVRETSPRVYIHCFVALDPATYRPTKLSLPFTFRGKTIEYCLGVENDSDSTIKCLVSRMDNNPIVLTISHNDIHWIPIASKLISLEDVQEVSLPLDA
jgi:glycosyltransferase involved in cell wall biosynthesis